ncbi:uncharacterized protein BYT42DRAFT_556312 [Radiomyces spectabilis]|uniref:uncharacterized protein n=1 Tax=Radiomyces spectabilis TaxID=64574 RepID=UPI00221E8AA6|nr:uncharacterized protein BYT42DRAFT_556312 [Radiomyces spectabilis]KAI8391280.1 hypothetical protein BYT42DRAFT_556312 [Radiomyces spectabilis]
MKIYTIALLSLVSSVLAFEKTVPCMMWSPRNYLEPKPVNQLVIAADDAPHTFASQFGPNICDAKIVTLIDQPKIHNDDFTSSQTAEAFAVVKEHYEKAGTKAHISYINDEMDIKDMNAIMVMKCDSVSMHMEAKELEQLIGNEDDFYMPKGRSLYTTFVLPPAKDVETLKENAKYIEQYMNLLETLVGDNYVVLYTSSKGRKTTAPLNKRALTGRAPRAEQANLPIFAKYQLFTPGIFMGIGVSFLLLVILVIGITWLGGIQTPIRFEGKPKKQ